MDSIRTYSEQGVLDVSDMYVTEATSMATLILNWGPLNISISIKQSRPCLVFQYSELWPDRSLNI